MAALDGILASGSGDTGFEVLTLATEGKVVSPKVPVGTDVALTRSDMKDFEETTKIAKSS